MSYSAGVKNELFNLPNKSKNENIAELLGVFMAKNSIKENGSTRAQSERYKKTL